MADKMYPYQGEARYPVEFGPGQSPMPMEHSGMARYGYPGYFPTKGPDGAAYDQNSVPQHAPPSLVGGKPGAMAGQEGMYGPGWVPGAPGQGYVAAAGPGKAVGKQDYFHGHMSSRRREMAVPRGGYSDAIPSPMSGYPGGPSYSHGPPYMGTYTYGSPRQMYAQHSMPHGAMPGGGGGGVMESFPDGRGQTMIAGGTGGLGYPPTGGQWAGDPSRRAVPGPGPAVNSAGGRGGTAWSQDMSPGQWSYPSPSREAFPSEGPSTPRQSTQQPGPAGAESGQVYRQHSSQSMGVASPQTPFGGELQKQSSVSSLRDALLATTPVSTPQTQQFAYSPHLAPELRDATNQPSPMTPTSHLPPTPDASTPAGAGTAVISPTPVQNPPGAFAERQDSQLSTESLSSAQRHPQRRNSELDTLGAGGAGGGSPMSEASRLRRLPVEDILGIKNDKPVDSLSSDSSLQCPDGGPPVFNSLNSSVGGRMVATERSEGGAPMHLPLGAHEGKEPEPDDVEKGEGDRGRGDGVTEHRPKRRPSSLEEDAGSPTVETMKVAKSKKVPVMSPVDRSHPSIVNQYNYSDEEDRKAFLDALFSHLEEKGIPLLRLPTICKAPLDLYRTYFSVQRLGGFLDVAKKDLWRDVLKTTGSSSCAPNATSIRTLQQCYTKLLLPYECHKRNMDVADCLARWENSRLNNNNSSGSAVSSPANGPANEPRSNHTGPDEATRGTRTTEKVEEGKMNGTVAATPTPAPERSPSVRINSLGSTDSSLGLPEEGQPAPADSQPGLTPPPNSQPGMAPPPNSQPGMAPPPNSQPGLAPPPNSQPGLAPPPDSQPRSQCGTDELPLPIALEQNQARQEDSLDLPDASQNVVDAYSPGSPEPLPDISVSDAESLLGVSPSPYTQTAGGGPGTPSAPQTAGSPSYAQGYSSSNSREWPGFTPSGSAGDMSKMAGPIGSPAPPPSYPPSYPMPGGYSQHPPSHASPVHPGYAPYATPPPHPDLPPEFHQPGLPPHLMRSPYAAAGSPYSGLPHSMGGPMGGPQSMDPALYGGHYHTAMGPHGAQPQPHMMHRMDEMGYPGTRPGGMLPEWAWQQHRSVRYPSPLPSYMQSPSSYARGLMPGAHSGSSSPRPQAPHGPQLHAAGMAPMQVRSGSPGHTPHHHATPPHDAHKIHWQDRMKGMQAGSTANASSLVKPHEQMSPKPTTLKPEKGVPRSMSVPGKSTEHHSHHHHHHHHDSLKRPLPDWSHCVEGTKPKLAKRRHLFSGDCGHVEPWRMMMSLKSGILAESTWALDTLNILLHDDRTVGFFYLKHHQNLLNTLVEHLRVTLVAIFGGSFDILPCFLPGYEGVELEQDSTHQEAEGEAVTCRLAAAATTDHDELSSLCHRGSTKSNGENGSKKGHNRVGPEGGIRQNGLVPVASVYENSLLKLGQSNDLAHIQLPSADDKLHFQELRDGPVVLSEDERQNLEKQSRIHRIDATPMFELHRREEVLSRIPIHSFGRLSRSPRRRTMSFLDDIKARKEIEGEVSREERDADGGKNKIVSPSHGRVGHGSSSSSPAKTEDLWAPESPDVIKEESEIHQMEQLPLWSVPPSKELLRGRCLCVSNILRSLSFIPGNDLEFSQHAGMLMVLGQILMLHHNHLIRRYSPNIRPANNPPAPKEDEEDGQKKDTGNANEEEAGKVKATVTGDKTADQRFPAATNHWWWYCLDVLRENVLVILSNISGQLDLSIFPETVSYPVVSGLLHWTVCPSAYATDALPDSAKVTSLSPQRLVLETLAKMSISEANVDFILATPPLTRQDRLFSQLVHFIGQKRHPVMRQFALVLLSNLAQGNEAVSRLVGQQKLVVSLLLECLENSEHAASSGQHINPDDPTCLSVAMLRRAATTLHCLAKVPANRTAFLPYRDRVLYLATSQYVEPSVSSILMDMLYELAKL